MPPLPATTLTWLVRFSGFPGRRLPAAAELLLLVPVVASEVETSGEPTTLGPGGRLDDSAIRAAQRAHAFNRSHAHHKSDNRAKV